MNIPKFDVFDIFTKLPQYLVDIYKEIFEVFNMTILEINDNYGLQNILGEDISDKINEFLVNLLPETYQDMTLFMWIVGAGMPIIIALTVIKWIIGIFT